MKLLLVVLVATAAAGAGAVIAAIAWDPAPTEDRRASPVPAVHGGTQDTAVAEWATSAPFRRDRTAPAVRHGVRLPAVSAPAAPARPRLMLRGILSGTQPAAIVEGLPGAETARAVRMGDVFGELKVTSIAGGTVEVRGPDTTWHLRISSLEQSR